MRGQKTFSDTFRIVFLDPSGHFSCRFKHFSGAISFCRRAARTLNRYTKRPLQDSAMIFSPPATEESALPCANHLQGFPHRFFCWKMPFAVFRRGSSISANGKVVGKRSKFHFARLTFSYPPYTSVFLPRPLTPLHSPVLARSSPGPLALALSLPTLVSSNLAVKTGKREIYSEIVEPLQWFHARTRRSDQFLLKPWSEIGGGQACNN